MVVLIDTNVAINYLTNRTDENSVASSRLMTLCGERTVEGYIAAHSIPTIWYVLRKYPEKEVITFYNRDDAMKWLISEYMIVPVDEDNIIEAACIHSISWQESHRAFCNEAFILKHDTDHQAEYIRNKIANGSKFYMLCDKQSMAVVSITDGLIEDLYVLPELQRQGYGTALLDYVITLICREGITPTLWILESNFGAEHLYRRKGFVPSGKQNTITGKLSEIEFLYKGL